MAERAQTHPLVETWTFQPDSISPRRCTLQLDDEQYPSAVVDTRLDIRWYRGNDYTLHYLESRDGDVWQCRWDRHPKPGEPREHFHPPPNASADLESSSFSSTHHLDILFGVLDWITDRVATLHDQ